MGARSAAGSAAADLADLFFKADEMAKERANQVRKNYRLWRVGDEGAGPHADILALNHASSSEHGRSISKMRRARTVGDALNNVEHWSASGDGPDSEQVCGHQNLCRINTRWSWQTLIETV